MEEPHLSLGRCSPDPVGVFARERTGVAATRVLPCDGQSPVVALLERMNSAWTESMNPEETKQQGRNCFNQVLVQKSFC